MRKIFLLVFLLPFAAVAQKFEVSEQAGMSLSGNLTGDTYLYGRSNTNVGFSDQVAFSYHPIKHMAVGAFYELNKWDPQSNSFGLAADFTSKYFFAGADVKLASLATVDFGLANQIRYNRSLGYGLHAGAQQKLYRRLYAVEQVGYNWLFLKGTVMYQQDLTPYPGGQLATFVPLSETVVYVYARVGLAYKF